MNLSEKCEFSKCAKKFSSNLVAISNLKAVVAWNFNETGSPEHVAYLLL